MTEQQIQMLRKEMKQRSVSTQNVLVLIVCIIIMLFVPLTAVFFIPGIAIYCILQLVVHCVNLFRKRS